MSSFSVAPRGRVPAMGRYSILRPCTRTSSSGELPASSIFNGIDARAFTFRAGLFGEPSGPSVAKRRKYM